VAQQWGDVFFVIRSVSRLRPNNGQIHHLLLGMVASLPGRRESPLLFAFRMAPRKRKSIGQVNPNCKRINEAIKDIIQVKNKCEVGYTPFL
jgi:hypothetical protein